MLNYIISATHIFSIPYPARTYKNISTFLGYDMYIQNYNGGNTMDTLALILSIIGSINWGLVGIFQFDLVSWIFGGQDAVLSRIIYSIIALAGLWCISLLFRKNRPYVDGE